MQRIQHINHSSIIVENDGKTLLTDPWYLTNAFHAWAPYPQPDGEIVKSLIHGSRQIDYIVISHAHDDHIDESFLRAVKYPLKVIIPKMANKSLRQRICYCGIPSKNIFFADGEGIKVDGFQISAVNTNALSSEDFVFLIKSDDALLVHANDNWQQYKPTVLSYINDQKNGIRDERVYLFSQIGIADSFPYFYRGVSAEEANNYAHKKCLKMLEALIENGKMLQCSNLYAYANQSLFERIDGSRFDPAMTRAIAIESASQSVRQMMPGDVIGPGGEIMPLKSYQPLIDKRLTVINRTFSDFVASRRSKNVYKERGLHSVRFICSETRSLDIVAEDCNAITVEATLHQWNRILCGECNLESIITGGAGWISKPADYNMRSEYGELVDFAYMLQSKVRNGWAAL